MTCCQGDPNFGVNTSIITCTAGTPIAMTSLPGGQAAATSTSSAGVNPIYATTFPMVGALLAVGAVAGSL